MINGKMVRIVDVHPNDARYKYRDTMIGVIAKAIAGVIRADGWFSGRTTAYPSQRVKVYDYEYEGLLLDATWYHHKIKVEVLSSDA